MAESPTKDEFTDPFKSGVLQLGEPLAYSLGPLTWCRCVWPAALSGSGKGIARQLASPLVFGYEIEGLLAVT